MQLSYEGGFWGRLQVWLVAVFIFLLLPVAASAAGDIAGSGNYKAGKAYFTGESRFSNGGPPCISCHNAGVGKLGGGSLGPDLTNVWKEKSYFIQAAWINGETTPVMGPVFSKKNVTEDEVADLQAFFSKPTPMPAGLHMFIGGGIVGCIVILIFFAIVWSGRYRSRCKGTAHDALWRNYGGKGGN